MKMRRCDGWDEKNGVCGDTEVDKGLLEDT